MSELDKATPSTARQPLKGLYVSIRLLSLVVNVPLWTLYYAVFSSPRASWTLKEAVLVRLFRYLMPLNALCDLAPLTTDKSQEVPQSKLKETSFIWLEPAEDALITGVARDAKVGPVRIPGYIWPKETPIRADGGLVGLWIHGGGYMMGNGSETFPENDIARRVYQNTKVKHILSLDYRVSSEACHPAQLQDALAAYSYLVNAVGVNPSKIVLLGACSGGHLVLLLLRYLYEEKVLPMPGSVMLFSPWVDMTIDQDIEAKKCDALRFILCKPPLPRTSPFELPRLTLPLRQPRPSRVIQFISSNVYLRRRCRSLSTRMRRAVYSHAR
ncbi:Alpha/Beta hydrolase protein [Lyophyllum atratum]|nr:Alpha/Beta hydrolase protein [Lyophyllum atratum]